MTRLTKLKTLNIGRNRISDAGLMELEQLKDLADLDISQDQVTAFGVRRFRKALIDPQVLVRWVGSRDGDVEIPENSTSVPMEVDRLAAAKKIESFGGTITRNSALPFQPITGIDLSQANQFSDAEAHVLSCFSDLHTLNLSDTMLTDASFINDGPVARLIETGVFRKLTTLRLARVPISDVGVMMLGRLPNLSTLDLTFTHVSDAGLAGLQDLGASQKLTTLMLAKNAITDLGVQELAQFSQLKTLDLASTQISDSGLPLLIGLKNLESLDVSGNGISDTGAEQIGKLLGLKSLNLFATRITDATTATLSKLTDLTTLNIGRNNISDRGLRQLMSLRNLKQIDLTDLRVTHFEVKRFQDVLKGSLESVKTSEFKQQPEAMPVSIGRWGWIVRVVLGAHLLAAAIWIPYLFHKRFREE